MPILCHVLAATAWEHARTTGTLAPPAPDGFLHCCTEAQLPGVLGRHFPGVSGLLVLRFDPARGPAELRWTRSEPDQPPFPHLHGPIPVTSVLDARPPEIPGRDAG